MRADCVARVSPGSRSGLGLIGRDVGAKGGGGNTRTEGGGETLPDFGFYGTVQYIHMSRTGV